MCLAHAARRQAEPAAATQALSCGSSCCLLLLLSRICFQLPSCGAPGAPFASARSMLLRSGHWLPSLPAPQAPSFSLAYPASAHCPRRLSPTILAALCHSRLLPWPSRRLPGKRWKCLPVAELAAEAPAEARRDGCSRVPAPVLGAALRFWPE